MGVGETGVARRTRDYPTEITAFAQNLPIHRGDNHQYYDGDIVTW